MKWFDTILFKKRINDNYGGVHDLRGMMKESLSDKNRILLFIFNFPCNITIFFKGLKDIESERKMKFIINYEIFKIFSIQFQNVYLVCNWYTSNILVSKLLVVLKYV